MRNIDGNMVFERCLQIKSYASAAGKKEGEGPLKAYFDRIVHDSHFGKETFEQAESEMIKLAVQLALDKADLQSQEIDIACCGDLLNQCVASSFAMRSFGIPYAGVYGACSTMALAMITAAIALESGAANRAVCAASSHYCTAERQYRFPLEYGSQRPPTAQWTVTAAGACILESEDMTRSQSLSAPAKSPSAPCVTAARLGRIIDYNVTDQNNMGAAMAPANVKLGTNDFSTIFCYDFSIRVSAMDKSGNFMYDDIRNR